MKKLGRGSILGILEASGAPISKLRLMKLLFLLREEAEIRAFDFFPYRYGPYSWMADRCLDALYSEGLVNGKAPTLTENPLPAGEATCIPASCRQRILGLVQSWSRMSDQELIGNIYGRFPEYTVLSNLGPRLGRAQARPAVYTIGYEGTTIDKFLNTLVQSGIGCLLDVRRNPISRCYGFSKTRLSGYCNSIGVEYKHIPELGIPSEDRVGLGAPESYQRLFSRYEETSLPRESVAVGKVVAAVRRERCALLCFESDPHFCHRSRLANCVSAHLNLPVIHLRHS
jgi:hypothetical protein